MGKGLGPVHWSFPLFSGEKNAVTFLGHDQFAPLSCADASAFCLAARRNSHFYSPFSHCCVQAEGQLELAVLLLDRYQRNHCQNQSDMTQNVVQKQLVWRLCINISAKLCLLAINLQFTKASCGPVLSWLILLINKHTTEETAFPKYFIF